MLPMFVLRLSHSARAVHVCFAGAGQEAFLEGHVIALRRLGGVPRRIRYDNLRSAVVRVLRGRERVDSERFVALRSHYGLQQLLLRARPRGSEILVLDHYLEVLSRKPGALPGAVALEQAHAARSFTAAHGRFWRRSPQARRPRGDAGAGRGAAAAPPAALIAVHTAVDAVERLGSADPELVAIEARRIAGARRRAAVVERPALRRFDRPAPSLAG